MNGGRITLRKCDKLQNRREFDLLKERGKAGRDPFFTVLMLPPGNGLESEIPRFAVICSRRFHHRAVVRNRARRLISEFFRLNKHRIRSCAILVIPRRAIIPENLWSVTAHMERILGKAGLMIPPAEFHDPQTPSAV